MADNLNPFESRLPTLGELDDEENLDEVGTPKRRRRMLKALARPTSDTCAKNTGGSPFLNPETNEFLPTSKMSSKRKASSSARPSKTSPATSSTAVPDRGTSECPVIHASDIFGPGPGPGPPTRPNDLGDVPRSRSSSFLDDLDIYSDSFEFEDDDMLPLPNSAAFTPERLRMTSGLIKSQAPLTENSKRSTTVDSIRGHSAILFSREGPAASNEIFDEHAKLRYLPLVPYSDDEQAITKNTDLVILPSHLVRINATTRGPRLCRASWPRDRLPVEIFDMITELLSRDDVKSARLVNREWERKVSGNLFASSVVPFNTELYDMIEEDSKAAHRMPCSAHRPKGKGKAGTIEVPDQGINVSPRRLNWQNAKDDSEGKVYRGHGLRVFQGFGPYFRRFGMSFEVAEAQLARPPVKKDLDHVTSYYGSYDWPQHEYTRFAGLAGLERTADETLRMKAAFSNLHKVQDLGLSLDNGLGWLNGPDKSIHARIFQHGSPVFGYSRPVPDQQMQDAQVFWQAIQECHAGVGHQCNLREVTLARHMLASAPSGIPGLRNTKYANTKLWSTVTSGRAAPAISTNSSADEDRYGVLYTTFSQLDIAGIYDRSALVPAELRKEQKEWLLETDWAQRAFLECYMLAVIDNPVIFGRVKTLTITKVSSGLLPILSRESFWNALPGVSDVTIHVKPDWRTVERDNAGFAETSQRQPSEAVNTFYKCILRDRLCLRSSITKLNIGWAAGGEHAEGIFARNNHVLPAPITQLEHSTAVNDQVALVFRFVEHLTLHNCWMTPVTLESLLNNHASKALKNLVLDSVSLTAHPRFLYDAQGALPNQVPLAGQNQGPQGQWNPTTGAFVMPAAQAVNNQQQQQQNQNPIQMPMPNLGVANIGNNAQQTAAGLPLPIAFPPPIGPVAGQILWGIVPHPPPPPPHAGPVPSPHYSHWSDGHREGSWAQVLDKLSPGKVFRDFLPHVRGREEQLSKRTKTNLQSIEFQSCGYVKLLLNSTFDQHAIDTGTGQSLSAWFHIRQIALLPAMMSTNDRFLGRIAQHMPERELNALRFAWGLREGWNDRAKAEAVEYDGLLAGGHGRFSGRINRL